MHAAASIVLMLWAPGAFATSAQTLPPAEQCFVAAAAAERAYNAPAGILQAIALVETGRQGASGWEPWPWTINVDGDGRRYDDAISAMLAAETAVSAGSSVDVGCFQVNLKWHGARATTAALFDPFRSAEYAARYLTELRDVAGSWQGAAGYYHSRDPQRRIAYQRRVILAKNSDAIRERRSVLRELARQNPIEPAAD